MAASCQWYPARQVSGSLSHPFTATATRTAAPPHVVVAPAQLGIGVYSAPRDSRGTAVRGAAAIRRVTRDLGLHYADAPPLGGSTLRAHYSLADASLGVVRSTELSRITSQFGERCQILEVSGDLGFAETETMVRTIVEMDDEVSM